MTPVTYPGTISFPDGNEVTISVRTWVRTFIEITVIQDAEFYGATDGCAYTSVDVNVDLDSGRVLLYKDKKILSKGFIK